MNRPTENADVIINEGSRFNWARTNLVLTLLALIGAMLVLLAIFGFVYVVFRQFIWIYYLFVVLIGVLPIAAIIYIGLVLYKKFRSVQVIDVKQYGTIIRRPNGQLQVISPIEMYALETSDARRTPVVQSVLEADSDYADTMAPLPLPFPREYPVSSVSNVSNMETLMETETETVEPVLQFVATENEAAKRISEASQNQLYKERITKLHTQGIPLRAIAKIVGMEGRKYKRFKELCIEAGIDASIDAGNQLPENGHNGF